jgi:membrane protease YdiL (CAAX protease family)
MICNNCQHENSEKSTFCVKCGKPLVFIKHFDNKKDVNRIVFFYLSFLLFIASYVVINIYIVEINSLIVKTVFCLMITIYTFLNFHEIKPLLRIKSLKYKVIIKNIALCLLCALFVSLFSRLLVKLFEIEEINYFNDFTNSKYKIILTILNVSILPGIFEELAMRGVMFNFTKKISSLKATIIVTTIAFAFLHFSFISFLWIIPIGLYLGYMRAKYRTLIYGIIFHIIYNFSILCYDYFI